MLKAVTRQASLVDAKIAQINASHLASGKSKISTAYFFDHFATQEDVDVLVEEEDFVAAERELVPSVSAKELEHYGRVREQFEKVEDKSSNASAGKGKAAANQPDGIPEWQQEQPRSNGKGKAKEKVVDKKGKGKDKAMGRWDEGSEGDEDAEFYDDSVNGFATTRKEKGKGKEADMGFREGVEDDEGLY